MVDEEVIDLYRKPAVAYYRFVCCQPDLGAVSFAVLEQKSLADGLWWATVTSLTIGYGDLTPVTPAGRIVGILFGHFWIFIVIPMIVANIIMHLVEDKHLFSDEEQRELMQRLKRIEARLTQQEQDNTRS